MFPYSRSTAYESRGAPEKKRIDDYSSSSKRDEYKREAYKRPVTEYVKRDLEPPPRSNTYESRSVPTHRDPPSTKDRYGITSSESRPSNTFSNTNRGSGSGGRGDDRGDPRGMTSSKSRYMDSNSAADTRYTERSSGSSSAWPNPGPPPVKPFSSSHMQMATTDPWGPKQTETNWRSMDQNQDRYDRTYNERKSQVAPSQYADAPRQNSFVGGRPQERYNSSVSSRFENGGGRF